MVQAVKFDKNQLFRWVSAIVADEYARQHKRPVPAKALLSWSNETLITEDGIGFDSLARLDLASRLNRLFHMHEVGIEDYLLLEETLGGWVDIVATSVDLKLERLSFETSGSTGVPKLCEHLFDELDREAREWSGLFEDRERIITLVPPHHIFGFLFTVRLPQLLQCELVDAKHMSPSSVARAATSTSLIVATPHQWSAMDRAGVTFTNGSKGVSSTAPLSNQTWLSLADRGLSLIEVFGSSETAGIGHRSAHNAPFQLRSIWQRDPDADDILIRDDGQHFQLQDRLNFVDDTFFYPGGRRDHAVQVGGVNVFPSRVADCLLELDSVAQCAVRSIALESDASRIRLSAYIVPKSNQIDESKLLNQLKSHAQSSLRVAEQPIEYKFGPIIPRNEIGKPTAW